MRSALVPTLLFTACAADPRWATTRDRCGFEYQTLDITSWSAPATYPSEDCVDAVLDDLDVDRRALLAADGLDDPYGLVYGEDLEGTATGALLSAVQALQIFDLGDLDDARGEWSSPAFRQALAEVRAASGEDDVSALLYDYVAGEVHHTTVGTREGAAAGMRRHRLILYDLPTGIDGAAVLVHEARHQSGPDHLWCGGEPSCDRDASGSYGFQLAVHELAREAAADELMVVVEQSWIDALDERILAP